MMQFQKETTVNFQVDAFDCVENGTSFIGTEIFPAVLHSVLDEAEEKGYTHIVSWQPHGRCFVVHNRKEFVQFIIPAYFRMSKFASFQRQLNLYDYKRITAGPDKGGYYHDSFVRGRKELCKYMVRQQIKGTLTRKPAPESEPDFYRFGPLHWTDGTKTEETQMAGRQEEILSSAFQSDLMMNARIGQSNTQAYCMPAPSMVTDISATKPRLSNIDGNPAVMGRPLHPNMTFEDLKGPSTHFLMAAMEAAPRFQQFCNGSSVLNHAAFFDTQNPERDCYNEDNELTLKHVSNSEPESYNCTQSVVSMLYPPRYSRCGGNRRISHTNNCIEPQLLTNKQLSKGFHREHVNTAFESPKDYNLTHQSVVSMQSPYSRCDGNICRFHTDNSMEPQLMTNKQLSNEFRRYFDVTGFESFSTSFSPGATMGAPPTDKPFGSTDNSSFFNESSHFDWMPQKAYRHF